MNRLMQRLIKAIRFSRFAIVEGLRWYKRHGRLPRKAECADLFRKAFFRFKILAQRISPAPKTIEPVLPPYDAWLKVNVWNRRMRDDLLDRLSRHAGRLPTISLVMPVHNPHLSVSPKPSIQYGRRCAENGNSALPTTAVRIPPYEMNWSGSARKTLVSVSPTWSRTSISV